MNAAPAAEVTCFRSRKHPGGRSLALAWSLRLAPALSATLLSVCLLVLIRALQHQPILPYLLGGLTAGTLVAVAWTAFDVRRRVVECCLDGVRAAVRTEWDVLTDAPLAWRYVYDLRKQRDGFSLALSDATYDLDDADWPELASLLSALQTAREHTRLLVS